MGPGRRTFIAGFGLALLLAQALFLAAAVPVSAANFTVEVYDNAYVNREITISAGDTVQWNFRHNPPNKNSHSVTANDGSFDSGSATCPPICDENPLFHTFASPGDYSYFCRVHPGLMTGVVHVQGNPAQPAENTSGAYPGAPPPAPPPSGASQSETQAIAPPPPSAPSYPTVLGAGPAGLSAPSGPGPAGSSQTQTSQSPSPPPGVPSLAESAGQGADPGKEGERIETIVLGSAPPSATESQGFKIPPFPKGVTPGALATLVALLLLTGAIYGAVMKKRILATAAGAGAMVIDTISPPPVDWNHGAGPDSANSAKGDLQADAVASPPVLAGGTDTIQPEPGAANKAALRREGEIWAIEWAGKTLRLNHSKGLEDLSKLLLNPGREFHVLELAVENGFKSGAEQAHSDGLAISNGDAGPVLDSKAKDAYRQRLMDLEQEVAEGEEYNDPERASRARSEIDFIASELAAAVGLGGRDRKAVSDLERARVLVTKRIRRSIEKIESADKVLGQHLDACVKTGVYCVYLHDPSLAVTWQS